MNIANYFVRASLGVLLLAASLNVGAATEAKRLPNVVIIFCDDMGYADVGVFGAKGYATPNIDRMAKEGMRFTNFHVPQPVCSASRAGLLTGCYPNRIGIHGALSPAAQHGLNANEVTIAEVLKPLGYRTSMAGKWHLGHHPQFLPVHHGFDEYFGLPYSNDMWPLHPDYVNLPPDAEKRKRAFPDLPLIEGDKVINPKVTGEDQTQLTTWYTERAVRFIEKSRGKPFFLYVAHSMPHVPLYVSDKFKGKSQKGLFGDVIMEIDWSVGEILKAIRVNGLDDNTLVIFTSDNGPWLSYGNHAGSAYPLREGKGTAWEGGVRVPCVMRWPGRIPANRICREPAMTIDLLPTIAKLTGGQLPGHKIDGKDIWSLMAGEPGAKSPQEAYFIYYQNNQLQSVLSGKWKLYLPHTYRSLDGKPGGSDGVPAPYGSKKVEQVELYDLESDVRETNDVASQYPEVVERIMRLVEECRADLGDALTKRTGSGVREAGRIASAQ
ncbi:MAG: sulfatase [Verrucomicrobiota bacterium]